MVLLTSLSRDPIVDPLEPHHVQCRLDESAPLLRLVDPGRRRSTPVGTVGTVAPVGTVGTSGAEPTPAVSLRTSLFGTGRHR
jgi:hypothetical protein